MASGYTITIILRNREIDMLCYVNSGLFICYDVIVDVKSVTQLMTGNDTTHRPPKQQTNTTQYTTQSTTQPTSQPVVTNGSYTNGYMPQKSPPMSSFRKTPPGSHGKPSPLMQRRMEVNA